MAFRLHKNRRKSTWYYARRVPLQYAHLDRRGVIQQTTGVRISTDPHGVTAQRVAERIELRAGNLLARIGRRQHSEGDG